MQTGFALVRAGYYWEAHELLEQVWLTQKPNSTAREFLRAIIQLANGLLKLEMDRAGAAGRLFAEAAEVFHRLSGLDPVWGFSSEAVSRLAVAAEAADWAELKKLRRS